ncbi:iron chelate uptake ABC transporter family permease subunit [uncultured Winogradskyella sp.]|uniref:iron chelate uptake ABC transporter family permease subunit n=1 Tax=uncultured Winogradskyella sp. TaxID=395353 RepID=UPI0030EC8350|tara:strand:- start:2873 stop:3250 length:378 start_codon:yes stop_codon:yes gene_type:complete
MSFEDLVVLLIFFRIYALGVTLSIASTKVLNALLLRDNYAKSHGLSLNTSRFVIILATSLIARNVTTFADPKAFIGLAILHLSRQIFKTSNHKILLPAVFLFGTIVMLICNSITQVTTSEYTLSY